MSALNFDQKKTLAAFERFLEADIILTLKKMVIPVCMLKLRKCAIY